MAAATGASSAAGGDVVHATTYVGEPGDVVEEVVPGCDRVGTVGVGEGRHVEARLPGGHPVVIGLDQRDVHPAIAVVVGKGGVVGVVGRQRDRLGAAVDHHAHDVHRRPLGVADAVVVGRGPGWRGTRCRAWSCCAVHRCELWRTFHSWLRGRRWPGRSCRRRRSRPARGSPGLRWRRARRGHAGSGAEHDRRRALDEPRGVGVAVPRRLGVAVAVVVTRDREDEEVAGGRRDERRQLRRSGERERARLDSGDPVAVRPHDGHVEEVVAVIVAGTGMSPGSPSKIVALVVGVPPPPAPSM